MIYESVSVAEPICQGDIFRHVPKVDFSGANLVFLDDDDEHRHASWRELIKSGQWEKGVAAVLQIRPAIGIVITQDCDASRGRFLSLAHVEPFLEMINQQAPKTPKAWQSLITKHCRENIRFFYMPADSAFGFEEKMAADFRDILPVPRADLENLRDHRLGRLNKEAYEHFRETLAQFFRRYPYDEWYPLTIEEFDAYKGVRDEDIKPRPWQNPT